MVRRTVKTPPKGGKLSLRDIREAVRHVMAEKGIKPGVKSTPRPGRERVSNRPERGKR